MIKKRKYDLPGIAVIEYVLLLVIVIALIIIFKDQLTSLINNVFDKIWVNEKKIIG